MTTKEELYKKLWESIFDNSNLDRDDRSTIEEILQAEVGKRIPAWLATREVRIEELLDLAIHLDPKGLMYNGSFYITFELKNETIKNLTRFIRDKIRNYLEAE